MPYAPRVWLPTGRSCVPQHYLEYRQSAESLAQALALITCRDDILLFGGADEGGMFVQVGVIGRENYRGRGVERPKKIVYGRKWRIETYTPTSELLQTAYLAIKKAREHELRELFTLRDEHSDKRSAALSCHLDLPLLAHSRDWLRPLAALPSRPSAEALTQLLAPLRFAGRAIELLALEPRRNGRCLLDLRIGVSNDSDGSAEFDGLAFSIELPALDQAELIYEVMEALIRHSDRQVEESFHYDGFARFSRRNDPLRLARLSIASRAKAGELSTQPAFSPVFKRINEELDAGRAPAMGDGILAQKNRRMLAAHGRLLGVLPHGY
jgi:hypothetical protein